MVIASQLTLTLTCIMEIRSMHLCMYLELWHADKSELEIRTN